MPDIDTPSLVNPKLQAPHALHLVHNATGAPPPQRLNQGHRRHVHACNSLAWQIFEAFSAAGHSLHATEQTMRAVAADPVENHGSHAAASPQCSARMRFRQWISDRYLTWKQAYRIRAMIAYLRIPV